MVIVYMRKLISALRSTYFFIVTIYDDLTDIFPIFTCSKFASIFVDNFRSIRQINAPPFTVYYLELKV
jgi:hypothetical protein